MPLTLVSLWLSLAGSLLVTLVSLWYLQVACSLTLVSLRLSLAGSLLVACAHFGAYVVGADIDYKLLHGRGLYTDTVQSTELTVHF